MNPFEYSFFFNRRLVAVNPESPVNLSTEYIFNNLNRSSRNSFNSKLALNNLLSNLITAHLNGRYLIISKSPNEYSNYIWYGLRHYTFRQIVGWVDLLIKEGFINQVKGYYDSENKTGKRTRLWIGEKLISTFEENRTHTENFSSLNYEKPVILKDKSKNLVTYKTSGQARGKIKFVREYNEFIESCQISFPVHSSDLNKSLTLTNDYNINLYHTIMSQVVLSLGGGQ